MFELGKCKQIIQKVLLYQATRWHHSRWSRDKQHLIHPQGEPPLPVLLDKVLIIVLESIPMLPCHNILVFPMINTGQRGRG